LEGLNTLEETIDWESTRAYAVGYLGGVYLNLRGREPQGIVNPGDYDRTLRELARALESFIDPDDETPLVTAMKTRQEIYWGERSADLPDFVLTLKDHRGTARHSFSGPGRNLFSRPQEEFGLLSHTGNHRPEGIFLGVGPRFSDASIPQEAGLMDIFPTCLELLGLDPPPNLDGQSLISSRQYRTFSQAEEKAADKYRPSYKSSLSPEEENKVLDNLRDLGYF
jgi:predicted AlkP superfamily phosphohydrolase/phosphomutase